MHEQQAAVIVREGSMVAQIVLGITHAGHLGMMWKVMQDDGVVEEQHFASTTNEGDRTYRELKPFSYIGNTVKLVHVSNMKLVIDFVNGISFSTDLR